MAADFFVHPLALNESSNVGAGTRIWAFAHVMKDAVVGPECNIGDHAFIESGAVLGRGVTIKNGVCVWEGITLEDYVFVGPNATFTNDLWPRSPRNPVIADRYTDKSWLIRTRICRGASIGANATILCGITIGQYALIAAGAVVSKNVPDFGLMVGTPARRVGWMCRCGFRLPEPELRCKRCGAMYRLDENCLTEVTAEERQVECS